jgi:hypothetical protein
MKKVCSFIFVSLVFVSTIFAQDKEPFFAKEKLFTGGSVGVNFGAGTFSLGAVPHFGISLNKYVDIAVTGNYNYVSQRDQFSTYKVRQSIYGPGAYVRLFPFKSFFAQGQYEYNIIRYKEIYGRGFPDEITKFKTQSFLVGGGYCNGRDGEDKVLYYYVSILFDVADNVFSPYKDRFNRTLPIIRAGFHVPLFQGGSGGKKRSRDDD